MSELPKGWVEATLKDLCEFNPKHDPEIDRATTVSFIPMPAVDEMTGSIVDRSTIRPLSEVWKGYTHFADADVIFAKITPCMENGKIAVARDLENGMACGSTEFHVLRSKGAVEPDFAWRFLRQRSYRQLAERSMTGAVGQRRVPKSFLEATVLPLPPLAEQKRIVAKLDALNAKSARARTELARIETLVSRYKQAVLSKAFSGELTREWRETAGVDFDWHDKTIAEIARIGSGQTPKDIESVLNKSGEVSWFKVSSMNEPTNLGGLRHSQFRVSSVDAQKLGLKIYPVGSIAFPKRGGAIATNKKRKLRVAAALDLNLMVLIPTNVDSDFLWWWAQKLDLSTISNGSNVPQINNGDIAPLPISVPPLEEQHEIVRRIESAFGKIDRLAIEAKRALELVGKLDEAILAKAFRGELVPQDENDEPAELLLERIRAEREKAPKAKRGRRTKA